MHGGLVQRVDGFADRVIIIAIAVLYRDKSLLQRVDFAAFLVREFLPGSILLPFRERGEDGLGFASRFDYLPLAEIFFRVVERLEQHVLDLFVGEAVSGL